MEELNGQTFVIGTEESDTGNVITFVDTSNQQEIEVKKDSISDFKIESHESEDKGRDQIYKYSCKLSENSVEYGLTGEITYYYDYEDGWQIQPINIEYQLNSIDITGEWTGTYLGVGDDKGTAVLNIAEMEGDKITGTYSYTPNKVSTYIQPGSYNVIVDVPVFAQGLNDQYLFKIKLPPFWSDHWESSADWKNDLERTETGKQNDGLKEILKQGNTYVTRYSEQNAISCPVFQFDYPSGWDIQSEEMSDGIDNPIEEKVVLVNDRGVTVTYWDCSRTLGGYSRSVVKAEISKVGDSEFVPGFPAGTNTDYSSLGSFMVAKVHLVGEMDSKLDSDYNATDSEFFAVVPASYEGEREFQGQAGFVDEFSFEYPTPYAFIAEAPDGQFTPEEEKEVIEILKSFKIAE